MLATKIHFENPHETKRISRFVLSCCFTALFLFCYVLAHASTVELPLSVRTQILQNSLQETLTPGPANSAFLYRQDSYNYFQISAPQLTIPNGEPHFRCNIAAGAGFESLGVLPSTVQWKGHIEMNLMFFIDEQWRLRYRVKDSTIYDEHGAQQVLTSFVWNLSRRFLYPLLERFSFDLSIPKGEILELLRNSVGPEEIAALDSTLNTITVGKLRADTNGLIVPLLLTVASEQVPQPLPAQEPLTLEEIEQLQHLFEPLDAFLVFVVKSAGADFADPQLRNQLFDLLITSRYKLLTILAGEIAVDSGDPLRQLFIEVWQQLRTIVEICTAQNSSVQEQLIRYMTFINAGDALLALDAAAPNLGMHITTDGLRRLARMLKPGYKDDPLRFNWEEDPALRNLLNFVPEPEPAPAPASLSYLLLDLLVTTAYAEETIPLTMAEVNKQLKGWVPTSSELDEYSFLIAQLLRNAAQVQYKKAGLNPEYSRIFLNLVPSTAMIETCWRQFVLSGSQVTCIRSKSGSIGIMQINQHVWRGFYNIDRLKQDVIYNIQAGTEILMRYFRENGMQLAKKRGKPTYAARAAYAAYNAGPKASTRFMQQNATSREKRVDDRLWRLYQGFAAGGTANLATCSVTENKS